MNLQDLVNELETEFGTADKTQWPRLIANEQFLHLLHIVPATSYRLRKPIYRILDRHREALQRALPQPVYDRLIASLLYDATYDETRFRKKLAKCVEQEWHQAIIDIVYEPPQLRSVELRRKVLVYEEDVKRLFPTQWKHLFDT